jgi:hypothetical protein
MKHIKFSPGIALGLIVVGVGTIVRMIWPAAHFVDGFAKGAGLTLMIGSLIKQLRYKHSESPNIEFPGKK